MLKTLTSISRISFLCAIALPLVAQSNSKPSPSTAEGSVSATDKKFVLEAAQGGMAEVELGKLAAEKASSDGVKKFGQRMVDDHTQAGDQLKQIADSKGIQVPDKLSNKDQMTKDRLAKLSGEEFDRAYMNDMVKDHTQDVSEFKRESASGKDPEVKKFASTTLPTLKDHLREARELAPAAHSASNSVKGSQ